MVCFQLASYLQSEVPWDAGHSWFLPTSHNPWVWFVGFPLNHQKYMSETARMKLSFTFFNLFFFLLLLFYELVTYGVAS